MAALAIYNPDFERLAALRLAGKPLPLPLADDPQPRKSIIKRSPRRGFVPGFSGGPLGGRF